MRLPLCYPIESRDGTLNADSKMKNMVVENVEGEQVAVKRPGVTKQTELPPGLAQGLFSLNGVPYGIVSDVLSKIDLPAEYDPNKTYNLGSRVIATSGTWTSISPGNDITPPGEKPEEVYPEPTPFGPGVPVGTSLSNISGGRNRYWSSGSIGSTEYGFHYVPTNSDFWGYGTPLAALQGFLDTYGSGGQYVYYATPTSVAYSSNGDHWIFSSWGSQQYVISRPYSGNAPGLALP